MNAQAAKIMKFPEKTFHHPETATKYTPTDLPTEGPEWLKQFRRKNLERFRAQGIPTSKLERWKFTNLAPRVKDFPAKLSEAEITQEGAKNYAQSLNFNLDWIRKMLETPAPYDDRLQDMALWHLANAYMRDGYSIDVPKGKKVDEPLRVHMEGRGNFFVPGATIRVQEGAQFTVMEEHEGAGWNNSLTHIHVGKNAALRHYRVQNYDRSAVYTQNTHVKVEEGGVYEAFTLTKSARLSRNQIHVELQGEKSACKLYALNLLSGDQLGDTTYTIEHQAPNCTSDQFVRSLLDGQSHGVFQGKVHVHRVAQKTDGYQLSNALLLSDGAQMSTKPELEIYADDVKCSHGATTGQLNEEPLFYLRSRGLSEEEARFLLAQAFIGELTGKLSNEEYGAMILAEAETWLRNAL